MPVTPEVVANLDKLVNLTEGFSGAEVSNHFLIITLINNIWTNVYDKKSMWVNGNCS